MIGTIVLFIPKVEVLAGYLIHMTIIQPFHLPSPSLPQRNERRNLHTSTGVGNLVARGLLNWYLMISNLIHKIFDQLSLEHV